MRSYISAMAPRRTAATDGSSADEPLDAGPFAAWVRGVLEAIDGRAESDVPCGSCTACCTSSQFIHIAPDEVDTLRHIPAELLFPAPGAPRGHVLLGYDERGHCPMLRHGACTIYRHRPRTCRTYDCRVFPAAGLEPDEASKAAITRQVRRWRFAEATDDDTRRHRAVTAAAAFLDAQDGKLFEAGLLPRTTTHRAVLAVELHHLFLDGPPDPTDVRSLVEHLLHPTSPTAPTAPA